MADAVAFGDFLSAGARVQAADVGILLVPRRANGQELNSASEREKQKAFLKHLKCNTPLLDVQPHAEWMVHRKLLHYAGC